MVSPCRKCGATRTETIRHRYPVSYSFVQLFGYRLRLCAGCNCLRLIRRKMLEKAQAEAKARVAWPLHAEPLEPPRPEEPAAAEAPGKPDACPNCGEEDYRRSRRQWYERLIGRPPMARCRSCHHRFLYPPL